MSKSLADEAFRTQRPMTTPPIQMDKQTVPDALTEALHPIQNGSGQ